MTPIRPPAGALALADDLRLLTSAALDDQDIEALGAKGLEWLSHLAPYDLATIFVLRGEQLVVTHAAGPLADERVRRHSLDLKDWPSVAAVLKTRRARAFLEHDHKDGDGDPFDGVLDLPNGHSCLVAPLYAGEHTVGVLALDRQECRPYGREVLEAVEVFGALLGLALVNAEQRRLLLRLHRQEEERIRLLEQEVAPTGLLEDSRNPAVQALVRQAKKAALASAPVLLLGETGTGKEVLARALHGWSPRARGPFVKFNCAAIPEALVESELFGHEKGAFTGATRRRAGRFQTADGGTLLLDEVGDLSAGAQAKLLRVLQEGVVEPVGADVPVPVDVRILAATNRDLRADVEAGRFREDLWFRLDVVSLTLPPLRERLEDLEPLVNLLLARHHADTGQGPLVVGEAGLARMRRYAWPGNIRELKNALERSAILADGPVLDPVLPGSGTPFPGTPIPIPQGTRASGAGAGAGASGGATDAPLPTLREAERALIRRALEATGGKVYGEGGAAEVLGLKPTTLQSRMKKLGINRRPTRGR
jgi:transcriptional regulator with GAF, ATPase, and Fis domain